MESKLSCASTHIEFNPVMWIESRATSHELQNHRWPKSDCLKPFLSPLCFRCSRDHSRDFHFQLATAVSQWETQTTRWVYFAKKQPRLTTRRRNQKSEFPHRCRPREMPTTLHLTHRLPFRFLFDQWMSSNLYCMTKLCSCSLLCLHDSSSTLQLCRV